MSGFPLYFIFQVLSMGTAELCKSILTVALVILVPQLGLINFSIAQVRILFPWL